MGWSDKISSKGSVSAKKDKEPEANEDGATNEDNKAINEDKAINQDMESEISFKIDSPARIDVNQLEEDQMKQVFQQFDKKD